MATIALNTIRPQTFFLKSLPAKNQAKKEDKLNLIKKNQDNTEKKLTSQKTKIQEAWEKYAILKDSKYIVSASSLIENHYTTQPSNTFVLANGFGIISDFFQFKNAWHTYKYGKKLKRSCNYKEAKRNFAQARIGFIRAAANLGSNIFMIIARVASVGVSTIMGYIAFGFTLIAEPFSIFKTCRYDMPQNIANIKKLKAGIKNNQNDAGLKNRLRKQIFDLVGNILLLVARLAIVGATIGSIFLLATSGIFIGLTSPFGFVLLAAMAIYILGSIIRLIAAESQVKKLIK